MTKSHLPSYDILPKQIGGVLILSFGSSIIYPFPAVQYIPLPITTICQGPLEKSNAKVNSPLLIAANDLQQWQAQLNREYGLAIPKVCPSDSFPLLGLNCLVEEIKYRSFFVTMVGKVISNHYHFFYIPKRYFYKKKLFFELFDRDSAKRLARYTLFIVDSL